ncbi:MAG: ABC transporter permease [Bryobacteraceae bacterium]|jgi:putative ABC transport system permease protein
MHPLLHDLKYGARSLWKAPAFTAVALATLALGIGAVAAIFSVVDAALLKPLPFRDPERLLAVWENNPTANKESMFVAPANFQEWRRQSQTLVDMAAIRDVHVNLTGGPAGRVNAEELLAERVSSSLFPLLGVKMALGRAFTADEDRPGRANYALIAYSLWRRRFGADPAIAGKSIRLGDQGYTVLGVLPAGFSVFDPNVDIWLPLALDSEDPRSAGNRFLTVVARLKPDVSLEGARAEMETVGSRLEAAHPALDRGWRPALVPLREELAGHAKRALFTLLAAVGFLLLMACANVANLLLERGAGRKREIAVRLALGASGRRLAAQLLSESLLLSLAGGALGVALARAAVPLLARFGPANIPGLRQAAVDPRMLLFALACSLASGLLFGAVPALQACSANLSAALTEGARGGTMGRAGRAMRNALVVSEMALAVVVLTGAGLLLRSFVRLRSVDPGFRPAGMLTFRLSNLGGRDALPGQRADLLGQLSERIGALPGVRGVAAVSALPLSGLNVGTTFSIAGRPALPPDRRPMALLRTSTPAYFRVMGIPLAAGREFTAADDGHAPAVLILSRAMARRFWPGKSPLGEHVLLDALPERASEVVGVAGDVKPESLEGDDWPTVYVPYAQSPAPLMNLVVRATPPLSLAPAAEREVHRLDPDQPVADPRAMDDLLDRVLAAPRFNAALLAVFAEIAFTLAAVGIYGVISCDVAQRTREIGIRAAMGARPVDVLLLILGQGARLAACGIALGLAAAFLLTRLMANLLFQVKPADAWTFASISLLFGAVALMASYLPARRAMAVDPVTALHHE